MQVRYVPDKFADTGYPTTHDTPNGTAGEFPGRDTSNADQTVFSNVAGTLAASRQGVY